MEITLVDDKLNILTESAEETANLGRMLAELVRDWSPELPLVILLNGQLGTGKTCLSQGIIDKLAGRNASSPSYSLINQYQGSGLEIYHIDLYRVNNEYELEEIGIYEILLEENLILIEWPELIRPYLENYLEIKIEGQADQERKLVLTANFQAGQKFLERVKEYAESRN
ncbi:MAG: tRNA (adenosine(37)-N6)-threonylcarbamoyltransferase complex ATPase subunit type 1 TsaE [Halarsenatibacteraceae bacterium]